MTTPAHDKLTEPAAGRDMAWNQGKVRDATACSACPTCQAEIAEGAMSCEQCGAVFTAPTFSEPQPKKYSMGTFSVGTLMLMMTLASAMLAIFTWEPGLGFMISLLIVPAIIRTFLVNRRIIRMRNGVTRKFKFETFFHSLLVTFVAWVTFAIVSVLTVGTLTSILWELLGPSRLTFLLEVLLGILTLIIGFIVFACVFRIMRD